MYYQVIPFVAGYIVGLKQNMYELHFGAGSRNNSLKLIFYGS